MKLYTEEQVRQSLMKHQNASMLLSSEQIDYLIEEITPIELPSDEEIQNMGKDVIVYNDIKRGWFVDGLRFMRDKIQGGNK